MAKHRRAYPTVHAWMEATGHSQYELAQQLGICDSHLSNILSKTRKPSLDVALKLSRMTNVPIESIVTMPADFRVSE